MAEMKRITSDELKKHNTRDSCWVAIHGKVWDVTDFLDAHPGGASVIFKAAGGDLTKAYDTIHEPVLVQSTLPADACQGVVETLVQPPAGPEEGAVTKAAQGPPLSSIINVDDFERVAKDYLSDVGWAYYAAGAEDEISLDEPRKIFRRIALRPRILRDVGAVDTSCTILGQPSTLPIYISPTGQSRYAYRDGGEQCIARACGHEGVLYCMPTSAPHEAVFASRVRPAQPLAFQLYTGTDYERTRELIRKVERLGAAAIFVTVDSPVIGRRERDDRIRAGQGEDVLEADGVAKAGSRHLLNPHLTWDDLGWMREATKLPLIIKGVQTVEDAVEAYRRGADGVVLSNHGGRSQDTAQAPMLTLLEIRRHAPRLLDDPGIRARFAVLLDGGVRRGTDVLKAVALGATAVGVGRPALFALTNGYGEAGVRRLIRILRQELTTNMALVGATTLDELVPHMVNVERIEHRVQPFSKLGAKL